MGSSRPSMDSSSKNSAVFWMIWTCQGTYWSFSVLDLMVLLTLQNISRTLDEKCLSKTTLGQVSPPALSDPASLPFRCSFSVSFRWVCSCFHLYLMLLVSKKWPMIVSKTGRCLRGFTGFIGQGWIIHLTSYCLHLRGKNCSKMRTRKDCETQVM